MLNPIRRWWPLALVALFGLWLRVADLERRPMQADEANQAVKTGTLLEHGQYAFDPRDHHGPTLYYLALPIAWVRGESTLAGLSETTVRLVPALLGTLSILLLAALAAPFGRWPATAAAALVAVSPPAVYYSRYFVQETLLVTFTLATFVAARAWWQRGYLRWMLVAGAFAGAMQATKASAPLFLAAGVLAAMLTRPGRPAASHLGRDVAFGLAAAVLVAALFYSSFGTHPAGLRDAVNVYFHAGTRLAGTTGHEKPWWYYFQLFGWQRSGGLVWQQLAFAAVAVAGFGAAWNSRDRLLRWSALYSAFIATALALSAYKTPWHAVHLITGMSLLAAGLLTIVGTLRHGRWIAVPLALIVIASLLVQARLAVFLRPADARNPYAYVHAGPDVRKFRGLVDTALTQHPGQPVRVISEEYWPLPWYLRGVAEVGYWSKPPADCEGALVIASQDMADAVRGKLARTYRESFLGLRPGVVFTVFTPEP